MQTLQADLAFWVDTATMPRLVKVNFMIAALFLGIALLLFLFIVLSRYRDGVRLRKYKWMEEKAQAYITSYLFDEEENVESPEDFRRKYLTNSFRRQVFMQNLILLHKNLLGETSDKLSQLYQRLGLLQHSKQKLYASKWNTIAEGIGELTEMGVQQEKGLIRSFINHPHPILRSEAQAALVRLDIDAPFSFLNDLAEPLTDWEQLQLARAAQKAHLIKLPDFSRWLTKQEESIVIFSIRMIVQYAQHQAEPALLRLLHHPSPNLRKEVFLALRQLETFAAAEQLMALYPNETPENKAEILKTLPVITFEETFTAFQRGIQQAENEGLAATRVALQAAEPA
ncbi:hypothetical protein CLV24_11160 [Pontibacter ummariensis]|uniref:HEAT repeat-containing protein n=1 Tax=Pontibacter ummariensis TaxID=1610492 RepID=A0A239GHC0_9BACT|nr:HEAT repeat domain-containing protein [Pontibacter ummariensis]PRY11265.1 hypothetical protein CLV24_11160 [Pontibacter ummariensis]SNS68441.1 hypothetical protein SAMN06296052_11160 [Pontibacter ummariensis]